MNRQDTAVWVVDMQEKLLQIMQESPRLIWNVRRLVDAAQLLGLPLAATEQYPQGLGPTVPELAQILPSRPEKLSFSCTGCEGLVDQFREQGLHRILLTGIETHVCVLQTALDLIADGWRVYLPVDAVGSRHQLDHQVALRRMEGCGVTLTTTESAIFELCQTAEAAEFKQLSNLVKQKPPETAAQQENR